MSEPTRLRERGGPGALLLGAAADDGPSATSFERTARRLGVAGAVLGATSAVATTAAGGTAAAGGALAGAAAATGAATGTGLGAGVAAGSASVLAAKVGFALVLSAALVGGATIAARPSAKLESPTPSPATSATIVAPVASNAAIANAASGGDRAPEGAPAEPPVVLAASSATPAPSPVETSPKKATTVVKPAAPDPLHDEVARLDEARAKLARGDAAGALVSLDQHDREFPRGLLGAEADVLRVEALVKAGRRDEARARGERLLAREPNGPHAKRLRTLLGL
ncbi:MAG: hypothetical protein U0183_29145 [Polyangiaceae bacterium]